MPSTMFKCPASELCKGTDKVCYSCSSRVDHPNNCDCFSACFYQGKVCETCEHLERIE